MLEIAAQERFASCDPELVDAEVDEDARDALDLLEREELAARQETVLVAEDLLRHAVHAAEVAAVGDRDPQVAHRPSERVDEFHLRQSVENPLGAPARPSPRARRRHRDLGRDVRPGTGRDRAVPALRVPRGPVHDLDRRARAVRVRAAPRLPRQGYVVGVGVGALLATAYGFQTAGLELTTVASTGFITGLYVVFTPLLALVFFGTSVPRVLWLGIAFAVAGLLLLNGVPGGSTVGNVLVLANAVFQALQITAMERYAPRYDPRALTFLQMATSAVAFTVIALSLGELEVPHGATVWGALVVTGVFAGALGYLIATWVQARTTAARAALVFTLEAPFAALFGVLLADEVLGWAGWLGCAVMMAGIVVAEPAASATLRRIAGRSA